MVKWTGLPGVELTSLPGVEWPGLPGVEWKVCQGWNGQVYQGWNGQVCLGWNGQVCLGWNATRFYGLDTALYKNVPLHLIFDQNKMILLLLLQGGQSGMNGYSTTTMAPAISRLISPAFVQPSRTIFWVAI